MSAGTKTQYDGIARRYSQSKQSPLRRHVEAYTFFELIGDVTGLAVLDLACGDGFYTRQLKQRGADRVVGVDISTEMIAIADEQESEAGLGIEYVCSAVEQMPDLGQFDLVVAAYLLHYAPAESALNLMCQQIARHLATGGRFVTLNENPEQDAQQYPAYTEYGFNKVADAPLTDGTKIKYWMISGRQLINFEAYFFTTETYDRAFEAAGLQKVTWHPLRLSEAGIAEQGVEYWSTYMDNPPIVGIECSR